MTTTAESARREGARGHGYEATCAECGRRSPVFWTLRAVMDWMLEHDPGCSDAPLDVRCELCGGVPCRESCGEGRP